MPKVTLSTIGSRYGSIDALNNNFDEIEDAIENTLSRDGTSPNEMLANFNMGGNRIINVQPGISPSDVVTLSQLTQASSDVFVSNTETVVATENQTNITFTSLTYSPGLNALLVFVNGSKQRLSFDYNETSPTTIAFLQPLNGGDIVEAVTSVPTSTVAIESVGSSFTQVGTYEATGGETNVASPVGSFLQGQNHLKIYRNGVFQTIYQDYNESGAGDSISFITPLEPLDKITFVKNSVGEELVVQPASVIPYIPAGTGAVSTNVQAKLREFVSVKDFGAVGGGVTDDTAAIQAADAEAASTGKTVYFPDGIYPANALLQTTGWHMAGNACILYNGPTEGECVRLTANQTTSGTIRIDLGGLEPRTGFYLAGNDNTIEEVEISNVVSSNLAWVVRSFYVAGNDNLIKSCVFRSHVNTGNTNNSSPQALVVDGTADGNDFNYVYAEDCRSSVTNSSTGDNSYGRVVSRLAKDNGFYAVAGRSTVDEINYKGNDNVCGFRSGADVTIGSVHILESQSTSIFFGDCGDITIGDIFVMDNRKEVLHLNLADTGHIKIGSIQGTLINTAIFAMPAASGTVRSLSIGRIDLEVKIDSLTGWSQNSWIEITACEELHLNDVRIDATLTGITGSGFFYARFPTTIYDSVINTFRVYFYDSDGITIHPTRTFFALDVTAGKTLVLEGVLNSSAALRSANYSTFQPGRLVGGAAPVAGTWRRGALVWRESPSAAAAPGWMCVASGTPGTWAAMANLA
jgi:hypothetical protein